MKVFKLTAFIALVYVALMMLMVCFIMFGGERRTESLSRPFTMYKVDMTLENTEGMSDIVQWSVPSFYYRGGAEGAVDVPFSYTKHLDVKLEVR